MAGRRLDSFDAYATADILLHWTAQVATGASTATIATGGRNGTSALQLAQTTGNQAYVSTTIDSQATWIVGFAFNPSSVVLGNNVSFLAFLDTGSIQVDLRINAAGQIYATRNGTTLGTATTALTAGVYQYVECLVTINGTTGVVTVKVQGNQVLNLTAQNTQATGNATANQVALGSISGNSPNNVTWLYDDLYINDGTAGAGVGNNTFLGDVRVQATHPTGAGHVTQFALGAGSANWSAVSDTTEDGDTTYVDSSTAGNVDAYAFGSVTPTSGSIPFVQTVIVARKDDGGTRTIADNISDGTTDHIGASNNVGTSYQAFATIHETDPVTSAAWTLANVNGRQYGVKEIA